MIESLASRKLNILPRLTIGIPTWNRVEVLREQLELLTPHLQHDVELLVCDNGSTDGTWELLNAYLKKNESVLVRCIRNGANLGADVNYLRVIEAANGEWVWLVGDDDHIDFGLIPFILSALDDSHASVVVLLDQERSNGITAQHIDAASFFPREYDEIGIQILQVGSVICKTKPTKPILRAVYAQAVGDLHAYSAVYGALLHQNGIDILVLNFRILRAFEPPRWNLMAGFLGAWESSLRISGNYRKAANDREIRLRQGFLLYLVLSALIFNQPLENKSIIQMYRRFNFKGKAILFILRGAFRVNRKLSLIVLNRLKPGLVSKLCSSDNSKPYDY